MPTEESWLDDQIILITWTKPITEAELRNCFLKIAHWIGERTETTHILFDITEAGTIPTQAPISAIRSGFLTSEKTGKVAVIGDEKAPQMLAKVATTVTQQDIKFFPDQETAVAYLLSPDA